MTHKHLEALEAQHLEALENLARQLTPGALTTDADVIAAHSFDEAPGCPGEGAIALVRARSVEDVQAAMAFAHARSIPVVPQGARSGISGGANGSPGAILLNLTAMNKVLNIDAANSVVTVEPGIINQDLKDALAPHGLFYPPDPGSVKLSTIGGNIATNAGGLCCVRYGVTHDFVRELKVVLPDGRLTRLGRKTAKGVAGLDICSLFVGSEGTLSVIVEATLKVIPLPPAPITAVATFPDEVAAARTVADFMASGRVPTLMELMDSTTISMLNAFGDFGLDETVGAMLIMQASGPVAVEDVEAFASVAQANSAVDVAFSDDPKDSEDLIATRRMVQPSFETFARAHGGGELLDDVCVPRSALPDFFAGLDEIRERTGAVVAVVAHAGDGNTHPAIFYDQGDATSTSRANEAFGAIMQLGLDLGGTITGEHGVGYLKREWLAKELDDANRQLHRNIKDAVDPAGIMNPGKMLDAL
ncbi:MAG TPA: FAD-binding protein [Candidatus Corynebacterium gallistercoris]|uniref:FAD-binding protein n=1 Tax=Candidatus Corynebacterium gallistercoris TaxID=2838530 RepID=A0A9D1RX00_9CORY|nr:FAD-binding protein [Candidatus Corynebacterium gallistercoris]